jgi:DNA polymerase-1
MDDHRALLGREDEEAPDRALLIDGHALIYRSYYAIRGLSTPDGRPVNAVYGFLRTLISLLRAYPSSHVAVAFDAGGVTHRHRIYPEYKATREPMPADLAEQIPVIQRLLEQLGIPILGEEGVEADDLLASLARRHAERGAEVLIVSSDKDLAQAVDERVSLLRPLGRGAADSFEAMDPAGVVDRYGVKPEQVVDWLALVGDSSDNVRGVPGVGEKTASKLLAEFGSLNRLLKATDRVANRRARESLEAHAEDARLARDLMILREDLPLDEQVVSRPGAIRRQELVETLVDLGFDSLLEELRLPRDGNPGPSATRAEYRTILTEPELEAFVQRIASAPWVSVDLETTSTDPMRARIVGVALSIAPGTGVYIPVGHDALGAPPQLSCERVLEALRSVLEAEQPGLIGQNLKYDLLILRRYGLTPRGILFDSMVASHLAHPEERQHSLQRIAQRVLGHTALTYEEVAGKGGAFASVSIEEATAYAAEDADLVARLREPLLREVAANGADRLLRDVEIPLIPVLMRMEEHGIDLDVEELKRQGATLRAQLETAAMDLAEIAGEPFNPNSPKQVAHILFEVLGLPVIDRTKTGPSTSARVLAELATQHALPGKLMEFREVEKLLNTYVERLPLCLHPETGRIHTTFHQTATATGRLSSSDPNLQNIPVRTEVGERIRRAFIAPEGWALIAADYSQIELRLLAHFSGDDALIEAFASGRDLHRLTASRMFGLPEEVIDGRLRAAAKGINFGIVYGISAYGLERQLGIQRQEAQGYIDRFYETYPGVRDYIDDAIDRATRHGYAETLLGRRRPLPNLSSRNVSARNFDRRNAINTPIQGSAADLIKLAMLSIDHRIEAGALPAKMLLQIHDELIFEVPHGTEAEVMGTVGKEMESVVELRVPLVVHLSSGQHWGEL